MPRSPIPKNTPRNTALTRRLCLVLATVGLVWLGAPPPAWPVDDERAVTQVFETARTALAEKRGAVAIQLLTHTSLDRLESLRRAAHNGDAASLRGLGPSERFAVQGLRRYVPAGDLRTMKVSDLANQALRQGWLGPNVIARSRLGPIRVKGDQATALLMVDNRPSLVQADFVREGGAWRIDLANLFFLGDAMLSSMSVLSGKSEDDYIADLLNRLPPPRGLPLTKGGL
jgi:hypothetical protein